MAVQDRSKRCQVFYEERELLRALRGGTKTLREGGEKWLPKEPGESRPGYQRRLKRSVLSNFITRAIKNLGSKPFSKPVVLESERNQELADEYLKAIDGRGTSLTALASRVFEDALWQGTAFIAVDAPVNGGRAYAYHLSADSILGFKMDEDYQLTEIRIAEKATIPDGDFDEKEVGRVRIFRKEGEHVTWDLWEEGDSEYSLILSNQPFALSEIPVMPIHASPVEGSDDLFAPPPLLDLAYLNLQHYQESSDQAHILHVAKVPVLFASGVAQDASIAIGSEYAIKAEQGSTLSWVEISGSSINAGRQSIIDLESRMSAYGAEMLQNLGAIETATGRALRAGENNNQIAQIAVALGAGIERVMGWIGKFNKISEPDFVATVNTDYGINISNEEITALIQARTLGDLSREDFLNEYKRRGIVRSEFNIEDNNDRLGMEMV